MRRIFQKVFSLSVFVSIALLFSCSSDPFVADSLPEGELALRVTEGNSEDVYFKSGGESVEDYEVVILKEGKQYARFLKYSEMPQPTKLKIGDYQIKAFWGANPSVAYDSPYYEGIEPFSIMQNQSTPVSVTCYLANVKMTFEPDADFKAAFSDYSVLITTPYRPAENAFVVSKTNVDSKREVFIKTGDIKLKLNLKKGDKQFVYGLPIITDVAPRSHYNVRIKGVQGGAFVEVVIDERLNDICDTVRLSDDWLVKDVPTIKASFDTSIPLVTPEHLPILNSAAVVVKSEGGIKELIFNINSTDLQAAGIPTQIKFSEMTPELKQKLANSGITWSGDVIGSYQSVFRFTELLGKLNLANGVASDNVFNFSVTDIFDQQAVGENFNIRVEPPRFMAPTPSAGSAWATFAYVNAVAPKDVLFGDISKMSFTYEYKNSGSTDWIQIPLGSVQRYCIENLTPNSSYDFRVKYKTFYSEPVSFTTENTLQLPNSGFEETWGETYPKSKCLQYSVPSWNTLNPVTCSSSGGNYRYVSYSGTRKTSGVSGNGAELMTIGWGSGNSCSFESVSSSVIKNITSAMLLYGDYANETYSGNTFASRPISITFSYKYLPFNGDKCVAKIVVENREGTPKVIGEAEFNTTSRVDSYTSQTLTISYNSDYQDFKATHIYVLFKSGVQDGDKAHIEKFNDASFPYNDAYSTGSKFYVDNVQLSYSK